MEQCKDTIESINIRDNKINKAIPELKSMILNCKKLKYLNISDLNMKKKYCIEVSETIVKACSSGS